jgi:hypothetical protein
MEREREREREREEGRGGEAAALPRFFLTARVKPPMTFR